MPARGFFDRASLRRDRLFLRSPFASCAVVDLARQMRNSRPLRAHFQLVRFCVRIHERILCPSRSRSGFWKVEIAGESDSLHWRPLLKIPQRLVDCLNESKVDYEILHHPEAVTAQRIAQAEHVKGRRHAKVVMVKSGEQHFMTALPADHQIDLKKLRKILGKAVSLEKEAEFKSIFPDCAVGAMPPLGNLYGVPTYVDKSLSQEEYIVFEAGTHTDAIKLSYRDYEKVVKPQVADFAIKIQPMKGE